VGAIKMKRISVVGFERRFPSFTEGAAALAAVWPDAGHILDASDVGDMAVRYAMGAMTDESVEADWRLMQAAGKPANVDRAGAITPFAQLITEKGMVAISTWDGGTFGWEPAKGGGFLFFIESWRGRRFGKGSPLWAGAEREGWYRVLETAATMGARRVPAEDLLIQLTAAREKIKKTTESDSEPEAAPDGGGQPEEGGEDGED
jgi:hypothetical protein